MKSISINSMAQVFAIDRSSLYSWLRRGCPCTAATRPGKPAQLRFAAVLKWREGYLADQGWPPEFIDTMATEARERLKALNTRRK